MRFFILVACILSLSSFIHADPIPLEQPPAIPEEMCDAWDDDKAEEEIPLPGDESDCETDTDDFDA